MIELVQRVIACAPAYNQMFIRREVQLQNRQLQMGAMSLGSEIIQLLASDTSHRLDEIMIQSACHNCTKFDGVDAVRSRQTFGNRGHASGSHVL
jgi:hypothetical protein